MSDPFPVTGAWRPGDDPGRRQFVTIDGLKLEAGGALESVTVAYETWGTLAPDGSNAVLVLHALTGDSHAAGPAGPGHGDVGWWDGTIGPGCPIDTDRFFVVCPNVLGGCQGTTGPASLAPDGTPYGSRFPTTTIRDQVSLEVALADVLGIGAWYAVIGGSMGGMRVLEWAVGQRERVQRAVVISVGAQATAEEIALCHVQMRVIRADPNWRGGDYYDAPPGDGPHLGLSLAREIGHISYRTELELAARFGRDHQPGEEPFAGGRYAVESYLDYHGEKLVRRFDANTYLVLSEAMNHHDVGRDRGGVAAALATITADVSIAGMSSDWLYPVRLQQELGELIPTSSAVEIVQTISGHDGFLVESEPLGRVIRRALG
ncbi:MAG: homoserine O-acetyltransferase/O-succinyltransferase [Actinomycetota bacterium]|nr:homoserine O-acetyltransferase/O-succinyltransferase [Actinomycetota bacterium]